MLDKEMLLKRIKTMPLAELVEIMETALRESDIPYEKKPGRIIFDGLPSIKDRLWCWSTQFGSPARAKKEITGEIFFTSVREQLISVNISDAALLDFSSTSCIDAA